MPVAVVNYARSPNAGGKFVVLRDRDDEDSGLVLFSDFTRDFQHADIVRRWRQNENASPEQSGLAIAGGGWWKMEQGSLVLYGQSAAYGRFDPDWLRAHLTPGQVFHETRIDVR